MHNETDLESQDESVNSDTDNRTEVLRRRCRYCVKAILTFNSKIIFPHAFVL